jgi:Flp pilus assembly pilin Flp
MLQLRERFANAEAGATSVEYGLLAAGIAMAIIIALASHGSQLNAALAWISSHYLAAGK